MSDTHRCGSCGDGQGGQPNPIDSCSRDLLSCDNPCHIAEQNTVACESLPSRLENFIKNFFGDLVRTEVNGEIVWSLPCGLDIGLPGNPRGIDEGLACYFLRLFNDGIIGLQGPQGFPGAPGCAGHNAYTVTLANFNTPNAGGTVQVQTLYNPAMLVGSYIFINGAGWYIIMAAPTSGLLTLQLIVSLVGFGSTVTAGKLVVPSGAPGLSIPGPTGEQGIQGPPGIQGPQGNVGATGATGPAGTDLLANNGFVTGAGGSDYTVNQPNYTTVNFGVQDFSFIPGPIGTYFVAASFDVLNIAGTGGGGYVISNISLNLPIIGSFTGPDNGSGQRLNVSMMAIVTTTVLGQTIGVQAAGAGNGQVQANSTSLVWFQIA